MRPDLSIKIDDAIELRNGEECCCAGDVEQNGGWMAFSLLNSFIQLRFGASNVEQAGQVDARLHKSDARCQKRFRFDRVFMFTTRFLLLRRTRESGQWANGKKCSARPTYFWSSATRVFVNISNRKSACRPKNREAREGEKLKERLVFVFNGFYGRKCYGLDTSRRVSREKRVTSSKHFHWKYDPVR